MFYLLIFGLFLVQEPVSSNVALLEAYQLHYNLWLVHGLFVAATLIDICVGYALGTWVIKRFSNNRFVAPAERQAERAAAFLGRHGEYVFLVVIGPAIFPYSTLVAPWLKIPFRKTLFWLLLGDLVLWYSGQWIVVLGIKTFVPNPALALLASISISLLIVLILNRLRRGRD